MKADYFKLAIKNLRKRKLRSWLTMLGIFISIATIFTLITLSLGLENAVQEQFRQLGTDKFFIMPKGQLGAPGTGGAVELTTRDVGQIEKITGIKAVSYIVAGNAKVEFEEQTRYFMVIGIPLEKAEVFEAIFESSNIKEDEGKMFEKGDTDSVMLGSQYKYNNIFEKPVKTKDKILINNKEFKVKSILSSVGNSQDDKNIYLSLNDFKLLFNSGERVDQIIVQIEQGQNLKDVVAKVEKKLNSFRDVDEKTQDFSIMTPEELLASFKTILNILTSFLIGIAAISLLVGGVGIANTMYTSILERTKEIGVMKAIGAKNSDILWIFLIESGLLGLSGSIIGIILGYGASKLIEYIVVYRLQTNLLIIEAPIWLILSCLSFGFFIGILSGTLPALQASKTKIINALRYE